MKTSEQTDVTLLLVIVIVLGIIFGFNLGRLQVWGIGGVNANNNARLAVGNVIVGIGNNINLKP